MKTATDEEVASVVDAVLPTCRKVGATLIVNDRIHVALQCGADGVHLGKTDMPWETARELVGTQMIIGGTVNSKLDAQRAAESGVLDYVGVGPFRFTLTKENLAPTLQRAEWKEILQILGELPSFAIGGIRTADISAIRKLGVTGMAISSGFHHGNGIAETYPHYESIWNESDCNRNH
tara:strand:+ start:3299 stop:3832 length:534 start_codon:yes stop_codon:yes gene_type:complete